MDDLLFLLNMTLSGLFIYVFLNLIIAIHYLLEASKVRYDISDEGINRLETCINKLMNSIRSILISISFGFGIIILLLILTNIS